MADGQPGGRVRLGNQALSTSEGARRYVADYFATQLSRHDFGDYILTELAADFACALAHHLSAQPSPATCKQGLQVQPSPGGQGDALKALDDLAAFCSDDTATVDRHVAVIRAALAARQPVETQLGYTLSDVHEAYSRGKRDAARQPVGEPAIDYEDLVDQAKDLIQCGCSVNGAFDWLLEQLTDGESLAARPAQAVGLGAVREALQAAEGLATVCASVDGYSREEVAASGRAMRQQFADALAKVDSQAVGNG